MKSKSSVDDDLNDDDDAKALAFDRYSQSDCYSRQNDSRYC